MNGHVFLLRRTVWFEILCVSTSRFVIFALLAHLGGAYAIPLALSIVRRESSVVCRLCPP